MGTSSSNGLAGAKGLHTENQARHEMRYHPHFQAGTGHLMMSGGLVGARWQQGLTWKGMLGTFSRNRSSRRQGSSCRNLSATSKVAPPHISKLAQGARIFAVAGAAFTMSCVRMRVASRDW